MTTAPLQGRVALVTGVSRRVGIGLAVARRLAREGARVFASGWVPFDREMPWGADELEGEELRAAVGAAPDDFAWEPSDLARPEAPDALVRSVLARFGRIDVVVAGHARSSHDGLAEVGAEELDLCWAVNARSIVLLAQSLGRLRPEGPGGRLVMFTSGQHIGPMDDEIAYAVSKGAIHQMTASLSNALVDRGITVNCINPGPTDTGYAHGEGHRRIAAMFPGGRWGTPDDVANLVAWLASDEGAWMTGQVLVSEGGFRRWARVDPEREAE